MPLRPPEGTAADPRLVPYSDHAFRLLNQGGDEIGVAFVEVQTYWRQTGGHLWWRRWGEPSDVPMLWIFFADDRFDDPLVNEDVLDDELRDWERGVFAYLGEEYSMQWLSDEEARARWARLSRQPWPPRTQGR